MSDSIDLSRESFVTGFELVFVVKLAASLVACFVIGAEREARGKPASISTHTNTEQQRCPHPSTT